MPIKWSATKVSEAMDEVEKQVKLAEAFLTEAKAKAEVARKIADLPEYIGQRLVHVISDIERIDKVKDSIEAVRKDIPDRAIEAERESTKHGSTASLM
jgi:hypothetical protein